MHRGPGGAPIDGSSALHLPAAVFSTARRACDVASDVLCRDPPRIRPLSCESSRIPIASGHQARLSRRLVKDGGFRRTRTPSIAECSLPRSRTALSRAARGITRSPPPVSLLACSWLSPPRPGFRRRFTLCARPRERVRARELDPWPLDLDQAPLVDFCNQHNPRARPPDRLSPVSGATNAAGVRLRASPASLPGVAFASPADRIAGRDAGF